ncbi:helix-turn-helix transcriptional regulator [Streptomyces sp. AGS-58]|uniref:helix-turn-helix transcriptional regulator n=1 Tax=unclassified Streptomyces TaxID=2593676 RepID=UPI0035A3BFD4
MTEPDAAGAQPLTTAELLGLPPAIDIDTAARALNISKTFAYKLAREDNFPCKIVRLGTRNFRVVTADLRRVLNVAAPAAGDSDAA